MRVLLVCTTTITTACASVAVDGAPDVERPELLDAAYVVVRDAFPPSEDDAIWIAVSGFPGTCEVLTQLGQEGPERPQSGADPLDWPRVTPPIDDTFIAAWGEVLTTPFWLTIIRARVPDADAVLDRVGLDGADWQRTPLKDDEFDAIVQKWSTPLDADFGTDAHPVASYVRSWRSDEGSLLLDRRDEEGTLSGLLEVPLVDPTARRETGNVTIAFRGRYCAYLPEQTP